MMSKKRMSKKEKNAFSLKGQFHFYLSIGGVIEGGGGGAGSFPVAPVTGCGMGSGGGLGCMAGSAKLTEGGFSEDFPGSATAVVVGEGLGCCSCCCSLFCCCCSLCWPNLFWSNFLRMSATETPLRMELATPPPPSAADAIADATAATNWHETVYTIAKSVGRADTKTKGDGEDSTTALLALRRLASLDGRRDDDGGGDDDGDGGGIGR